MLRNYLSKLLTLVVLLSTTFTLSYAQVTVSAPASVAGDYANGIAVFGPRFAGFSGEVAVVTDTSGASTACVMVDNMVNDVTGKVALIDRGACAFTTKALNAEAAGAIGVIICNSDTANPDAVINLGGGDNCQLSIPAVMLSYNDCQTIRVETGVMVDYAGHNPPAGPGDAFETAITITDGTHTAPMLTAPYGVITDGDTAVWYKYIPTSDGILNVNSCGGGADTRVSIIQGACPQVLSLVGLNDDACDLGTGDLWASDLDALVFAGQEYYIVFDDRWSNDGFDFNVNLGPLTGSPATFTVNMELETVSPDGVNMVWAPAGVTDIAGVSIVAMTDNGDGTWSGTIDSLVALDTIGYAFINGMLDLANAEGVPADCGVESGFGFNVRPYVQLAIDSSSAAPVCFGLCTNCPAIDITYTVDMTNEMVDPAGVFVVTGTGPDNSVTAALADNGDGTWSGTVPAMTGDTIGYFFVNGADILAGLETVPAECGADSGLGFLVRPLIAAGFDDINLASVCFGTCSNFCPSLGCEETPVVMEMLDGYTADQPISPQSDVWATWNGGPEGGADDPPVSTEQAASAPNSLKIEGGGSIDVLANMGDQTTGKWDMRFKLYVPAGRAAYYNIQDNVNSTPNQWNLDVGFETDGTLGEDATGSYPQDEWFDVINIIDLDNQTAELIIAGQSVYTWTYGPDWKIGSINYFPRDADHLFYVDDVILRPIDPCPVGAIICDDYEPYALDLISPQSVHHEPWDLMPGGSQDALVTEEVAADGSCQSLKIDSEEPDDIIVLLGNRTSGRYNLSFDLFIPAGSGAYHNIQKDETPAVEWGMQVTYDAGTATLDATGAGVATAPYPEDTWFNVSMEMDLDNDWMTLTIDTTDVFAWPFSANTGALGGILQLGSLNWFPLAGQLYYVDNLLFVGLPAIPGNICGAANDINALFGQAQNEPQTSGIQDNTEYSATDLDPDFGWECFAEPDGGGAAPSLERTIWYTFVGDGETYNITTIPCDAENYIGDGDTQIAVYSGDDCDNLEAVECNEDDPDAEDFRAAVEIETEPGVTYYVMIDGFGPDFEQLGEFCIEVTKLTQAVATVTFFVDMNQQTIASDGVFLSGAFNGWPNPGAPMDDSDGDGIYTLTVDTLNANTTYEYKFQNGMDGWEDVIDPDMECTVGGFGNNRFVDVGNENIVLDTVCFNFCVSCIDDVTSENLENGITIFPNPVNDLLTVQFDLSEASERLNIRLINTLGQVVYNNLLGKIQTDYTTINVKNLPSGTYMVHISDGKAQFTKTIVIQD